MVGKLKAKKESQGLSESKLMKSYKGKLFLLMCKLYTDGVLGEKGLFKNKIEELYREEYPEDNPKDLSQSLSDGCMPSDGSNFAKYAGKLGVVYERIQHPQNKKTGFYRLKVV